MHVHSTRSLGGLALGLAAILTIATGCPGNSTPSNGQNGQTPQGTDGTTAPDTNLSTSSYENWTIENTPAEWWTKREDTPWASHPEMVGEDIKLDAETSITLESGGTMTFPAGTSLWWRRLKPGYDILADKLYSEETDENFKRLHPDGAQHEFSGPGPFGENQLIIGSIGKSVNLNPILTQDTASSDINHFIFNRLIDIDERWQPVPQLAEGFAVAPDGTTYTYFLRKGVTFSDGTEVTAHDVEFTYSSILDENVPSPRKGDFVDLDRVEVNDDYTVTFHMKKPFAPWIRSNVSYGIIPRAQFDLEQNSDWNSADFNRYPIGGGPYILDKYEGDDVYLKANPNYFGKKPPLETIIFKKTPDQQIEQQQLTNHEIDLGSILIQDLDKVGTEHPEVRQFRTAYGLSYNYMGFNLKSAFFKDLKVRQAIAHAINRQNLIDQVIKGHGALCNANIPPMSPFFNPDTKGYDYNIEEAKKLLAEAGWTDSNNDGIVDKEGRKFSFDLITNEGNPYRKQIAELVQSDLKLIGIEAKPRLIEWSSFIEQFIRVSNFEAFILGWSLGVDPDDFTIFHSTQNKDGLNYGYYSNPDIDQLLEQGRVTIDEAQRKQIYFQIQDTLSKDLPYIFLFYGKKSGGALKRIDGLPKIEPNETSYLVPPLDASVWHLKGDAPSTTGPESSPE